MNWQPIETAPKDRCIILSDGHDTYSGFWHDGSQCYGHRGKAGWFYEEDMGSLLTASNAHPIAWQEWPEHAPLPAETTHQPPEPAGGGR